MSMKTPPGLFLIREDGTLVGLDETLYDSEALLQELLARYPELVPGSQIDEESPRRWLLISREVGVPAEVDAGSRWSLDHLFVDQEGIPTLIEVKRSTDTRIRREVVGQLLDYAANAILHWPVETIRTAFEKRCEQDGVNPAHELQVFIGPELEPEAFWAGVMTNLQAGRIRLLFVSDEIPVELRRIVEFLNRQMDPAEVLAVEVKQYTGQGLRTLFPRVFGHSIESGNKKRRITGRRVSWTKESFFAKLAEHGDAHALRVAQALFAWGVNSGAEIEFGQGPKVASFHVIWRGSGDAWFRPFGVYTNYTAGAVEIPLGGSGMKAPPFDRLEAKEELVRRLNEIDGLRIPADLDKRPSIDLAVLAESDRLSRFLEVMDWAMAKVAKAGRIGSAQPGA